MAQEVKLVVRLQDLDNRSDELHREVVSLPKHIAAIEKTLEGHIRKVEADRAALAANQRDRRQLEVEIQSQEQKRSKLKEQETHAKTNEQMWAFQHEIEFCEKEIRKLSDRVVDLMIDSERLEVNLKAAEAALAAERQQVEQEKQQARERTAADQTALDALRQERRQVVAGLAPELLEAYERIRKKRKGLAVAGAVDGRCSACHLALRLQFFQDLRRGEQTMFCESCGRILYYSPPESFEDVDSGQVGQVFPPVVT
ncbi:MAG: C4-type zinc ribbon domain-containing protein [Acidobacteriota bacterium]